MTASVWLPAATAALLSPLLLITSRKRPHRALRLWLHLATLLAFGFAARELMDQSGRRAAEALLASGGIWSGLFWILSIRRRLALRAANGGHPHPAAPLPAGTEPVAGSASASDPASPSDSLSPDSSEEEEEGGDGLEPDEQQMLDRLLGLRALKVSAIAVPRERMVTAACARGIRGAVDTMVATGFRRIPMADGSLDRIVGVVHAKDVAPLRTYGEEGLARPLKTVMRRALFVSRDRSVGALLEMFRSQRTHLAIVVDEFGRTTGLVSRTDVFRHLVGEGAPGHGGHPSQNDGGSR